MRGNIGAAVICAITAAFASPAVLVVAIIASLPGIFLFDRAPHFPLSDAATDRVRILGAALMFAPQIYVVLGLDAMAVSYIKSLIAADSSLHPWALYIPTWLAGTWFIEKSAAIEPKSQYHLLVSAGLIWAVRASEIAFWVFVAFPAAMSPWAWLPYVST